MVVARLEQPLSSCRGTARRRLHKAQATAPLLPCRLACRAAASRHSAVAGCELALPAAQLQGQGGEAWERLLLQAWAKHWCQRSHQGRELPLPQMGRLRQSACRSGGDVSSARCE